MSGCKSYDKDIQRIDERIDRIEYFTNLEKLDCSYNRLTTLDLSNNKKLVEVNAGSNRLESLNLAGCTGLKSLDCSGNRLQIIDISIAKNLEMLNCAGNKLVKLDVSQNKTLKSIDCSGNTLTALAVSSIVPLESLNVSVNQLSSLDLTKNVNLTVLDCHDNALTSLLVSKCLDLTKLNCSGDKLASLYAGGFTKLTDLDCHGNELASLGVNGCDVLKTLDCSDNRLATLDIVKNTALTSVDCSRNSLGQLNVSTLSSLRTLDSSGNADMNRLWVKDAAHQLTIAITKEDATMICYNNGGVQFEDAALKAYLVNNYDDDGDGEISIMEAENITNVNCSGKGVSSLAGLEACANLETLDCSNNSISTIRLPRLTKLVTLRCFGNPISELDLTGCIALSHCYIESSSKDGILNGNELAIYSYAGANSLTLTLSGIPHIRIVRVIGSACMKIDMSGNDTATDIDVSKNASLTEFLPSPNFNVLLLHENTSLQHVDVSALMNLQKLNLSSCNIQSLDVTKNIALKELICPSNSIPTLNVSGNANISVLNVDKNPELTTLNASGLGISELDLTKNEKVTSLRINNNTNLKTVNLQKEKKIQIMEEYSDFTFDEGVKFIDKNGNLLYQPYKIAGVFWSPINSGAEEPEYAYGYDFYEAESACPSGWRVPTRDELSSLCYNYSGFAAFEGRTGRWFSGRNVYSVSVPSIFLPAQYNDGRLGEYWSSTRYGSDSDQAYCLSFDLNNIKIECDKRTYAKLVRCVKD